MLTLLLAAAFVLVFAGWLYQQIGSASDRRRFAESTTRVSLPDGTRLQIHATGRGRPPVVLEAGISATSLSWSLVQPHVAEFTQVCSYDRAGLGRSDAGPGAISARANATHLHSLLRAAGIPPPYVLVGHSYGTFVIRAFAHDYPDEVAGLVFVDPIDARPWLDPSPELRRRLQGGVFLSRVGAMLARIGFVRTVLKLLTGGAPGAAGAVAKLFGPTAARTLDGLVGEVQKLPSETWPIVQACWSTPKCFRAMADHLAGLPLSAREVGSQSLGSIPTTVISGAHGWAVRSGDHAALAALSTRGRVIVAEHSGHWVQLDEPMVVVDAIRDLMKLTKG